MWVQKDKLSVTCIVVVRRVSGWVDEIETDEVRTVYTRVTDGYRYILHYGKRYEITEREDGSLYWRLPLGL